MGLLWYTYTIAAGGATHFPLPLPQSLSFLPTVASVCVTPATYTHHHLHLTLHIVATLLPLPTQLRGTITATLAAHTACICLSPHFSFLSSAPRCAIAARVAFCCLTARRHRAPGRNAAGFQHRARHSCGVGIWMVERGACMLLRTLLRLFPAA